MRGGGQAGTGKGGGGYRVLICAYMAGGGEQSVLAGVRTASRFPQVSAALSSSARLDWGCVRESLTGGEREGESIEG